MWFFTKNLITYILQRKVNNKLQIVIKKKRMEIMTYKQHLFFSVISTQISTLVPPFHKPLETCSVKFLWLLSEPRAHCRPTRCSSSILVRHSENFCIQLWPTWCDRQCSPYMGSISLWTSFAVIPFAHKNRTAPRCSIVVIVFRGAAILSSCSVSTVMRILIVARHNKNR